MKGEAGKLWPSNLKMSCGADKHGRWKVECGTVSEVVGSKCEGTCGPGPGPWVLS